MGQVSAVITYYWGKISTQYGLGSHKQPPPVSDNWGLTFWVVAYWRFDCITWGPQCILQDFNMEDEATGKIFGVTYSECTLAWGNLIKIAKSIA